MKKLFRSGPILVPLLLAACAHHYAAGSANTLTLNEDGTASLRSVVVENHNDCALESCYLTVHPDGQEVHVIYGHVPGECAGETGSGVGRSLKRGDRVLATGRFTREVGFSVVAICAGGNGSLQVGG